MAPKDIELPPPFDDLIVRHEREILRFCLRLLADREDALDLFQETWLRAYRAYPSVQNGRNLRAWLFTIATNLHRNYLRDRARRTRTLAAQSNGNGPRDETANATDGMGELAVHLRQAIGGLPERQRRALSLRKFAGLEYAEIAAELGCSPESARASVFAALKKIKAGWPTL